MYIPVHTVLVHNKILVFLFISGELAFLAILFSLVLDLANLFTLVTCDTNACDNWPEAHELNFGVHINIISDHTTGKDHFEHQCLQLNRRKNVSSGFQNHFYHCVHGTGQWWQCDSVVCSM